MIWYNRHQTQKLAGDYSEPTSIPIGDTTASEIVPTGPDARYLTFSNQGPNEIFVRIGGEAIATNYNFVIPPGLNEWGKRINRQQITAICKPGETATLMVALAPEITKQHQQNR